MVAGGGGGGGGSGDGCGREGEREVGSDSLHSFQLLSRRLDLRFFANFSPVIPVSLKWEKIIGVHSMGAINAFLAVPVEGREKF